MKWFLLMLVLAGIAVKPAPPVTPGFAIVELFTSEGCSSCPPADKVLAELSANHAGQVFVLGFHVDYWDRLGWKDRFSSPDYTARQKQYAQLLDLKQIYTPQAIVNGTDEAIGSDKRKLEDLIREDLQKNVRHPLTIHSSISPDGSGELRYDTDHQSHKELHVALVQIEAQTNVAAGENNGSLLTHVNIVRDFRTIALDDSGKGSVSFSIPSDLKKQEALLIVFVQDSKNGSISAAAQTTL